MNSSKTSIDKYAFILLGTFFLVAFAYFYFAGNYVLCFQETQSLFIFSGDYLHGYLIKPGGLLEYAAKFLTQFYAGRFTGSLILSIILTLPGFLLYRINKKMFRGNTLPLALLLIPSCLMMLMQANYYHLMEYNLGFVLILTFYLVSILAANKNHKTIILVLLPLFYYLAGAYVLIFTGLYIVHNLFAEKGKWKYLYPGFLILTYAISFLIFWKVLFLQPAGHLFLFPFPVLENRFYVATFFILSGYLVFYPALYKYLSSLQKDIFSNRGISIISVVLVFALSLIMLVKIYNPQTSRVIELQRLVFNEKWEEAVRFQESKPSRNLIGEYFYNVALSETGQLCDRLFFGDQDFGANSLVLPWGDEHLNRGAYFYYAIGLSNEAHRWAYEEMVVYGKRPQNMELLIKTSLINGDLRMARKYAGILKETLYYRDEAGRFEAMADNPQLINSDAELGPKVKILPKSSFFIKFNEPQNNLPLLLESQPDNKKAFEYYIAGLLLTKNIEGVMDNVSVMQRSGYTRIPRFIEEAVMIYYNSTKTTPDLGGLEVSLDTQERFRKYFSLYMEARKNPSTLKETMQKKFGNTFWFYYHFK